MRRKLAIPVILIVWLLIGLLAAGQRDYITTDHSCASFGSTVVTIVAGPVNYIGLNPEIECPDLPEPSE